jgi:hypothetical protein
VATLLSTPAIGYVNLADSRTITVSSAATGYPGTRLSNPLLSESWRTAAGTLASVTVDVDLGAAQDIDVAALVGVNLDDDATRRLQLDSESTFGAPNTHDSGTGDAFDVSTYPSLLDDSPAHGRNLIYFPGSTQSARYARFTLSDSGNADNYLKASVLWVGPVWQDVTGMQYGWSLVDELVGKPGLEQSRRVWKLAYEYVTWAEARALRSILRNILRHKRVLVVPHPTQEETFVDEAVYATVRGEAAVRPQPTRPVSFSVEVEFVEVLGH